MKTVRFRAVSAGTDIPHTHIHVHAFLDEGSMKEYVSYSDQ